MGNAHCPSLMLLVHHTCPMLLRVFIRQNGHYPLSSYENGEFPADQLQVYTWLNADLTELTNLIKEMKPETSKKNTVFKFAIIYPDRNSRSYLMKHIGSTVVGYSNEEDHIRLQDTR